MGGGAWRACSSGAKPARCSPIAPFRFSSIADWPRPQNNNGPDRAVIVLRDEGTLIVRVVDLVRRALEEQRRETGGCTQDPEAEEPDRIGSKGRGLDRLTQEIQFLGVDDGKEDDLGKPCHQKRRPQHLDPLIHAASLSDPETQQTHIGTEQFFPCYDGTPFSQRAC